MDEYRVNLDIYNGPLDLLLYLIRRDELDIYDIPIARVTEQYMQYVEVLQGLDANLAGEFLVMAATLMEIKTRMLLPAPEAAEDEAGDSEAIDPRAELVRQLLEYKAFKDAAGELGAYAEKQALRHPRKPHVPDLGPPELEIEDIQIWDLVDAFQNILTAIGRSRQRHEVIYDDTPIELHQSDLLDRLERAGALTFGQVFAGRESRSEAIGLFLAMLELIRTRRIRAAQQSNFGEIRISLNDEEHSDEEDENPPGDASADSAAPAADGVPANQTAEPPAKERANGDDSREDSGNRS